MFGIFVAIVKLKSNLGFILVPPIVKVAVASLAGCVYVTVISPAKWSYCIAPKEPASVPEIEVEFSFIVNT